jgi:hypothetical protein
MSASKKSGQLTCYQTGQFYLLPTKEAPETVRTARAARMKWYSQGFPQLIFQSVCQKLAVMKTSYINAGKLIWPE